MQILKQQLLPYLTTDFEKNLLEAAIHNLEETDNKLCLNNFAYAARELTRHFLDRLAPDEEVRKAPWFKLYDSKKPYLVTREQKIKYAIQGYFSDDFTKNELHIDLSEVSSNLLNSINELSKYTHVNPDTFDANFDTIDEVSFSIMSDALRFFMTILETQFKVMDAVYESIDKEMVSQFYIETQSDIDILATHHEVLGYFVNELTRLAKDDKTITMHAGGLVNIKLQYGSDGDMRRGDGYETEIQLPFTSTFVVNFKNQEGNIHIESAEIEVDNYSFFE